MKLAPLSSRVAAGSLLLLIAPLLAICAILILLDDGPPVLFRQQRIGRFGSPFLLLKLRTMRVNNLGGRITAGSDSRITAVGQPLRRYKLDELPQLWNIFRGEMRFIGPRPEVPEYVDVSDSRWQTVLSVPPGITDLASLAFRNEETLLSRQTNVEAFYRGWLLPRKLDISSYYLQHRSAFSDLRLLLMTLKHSLLPDHFEPTHITDKFNYRGRL